MSLLAADITIADLSSLPDDTLITLNRNAVSPQVALSTLRAYTHAHVIQASSPLTTNTVVMTDNALSGTLYLTPAATIASATVTLPTNANSILGQVRTIFTNNTITTLTVNGATTIHGNPTTLTANTSATFRKVGDNIWAKI